MFLGLVGITALLVGGIGIGSAVANYLAGKTATIATLKSLGASTRLVFAAYAAQIAALAAAGIAVGLALGAAVPLAAAPFLAKLLPVPLRPAVYPRPLAIAAASGALTVALFSLLPLAAVGRVRPAALFRDRVERTRRALPWPALAGRSRRRWGWRRSSRFPRPIATSRCGTSPARPALSPSSAVPGR